MMVPYANPRAKYEPIADAAADKYGIPRDLFRSLINVESGWKPYARSKAGAVGLTQLTGVIYKSDQYRSNPYNPQQNIEVGARFLSDLHKQYGGNWYDALSHYNAGFNLSAGRGYAMKVMAGGGIDVSQYVKDFKPSVTSGAKVANKSVFDKYADDAATIEKTWLQQQLQEIYDFFKEKILGNLKNLVLFVAAVILLWFGFKKIVGVK